jgi:hypothetical protein
LKKRRDEEKELEGGGIRMNGDLRDYGSQKIKQGALLPLIQRCTQKVV